MPANASFCPACGLGMRAIPVAERAAAAGSYFTFLPAAVFLVLPQYRANRFVRFHAWQSVFLWALFVVLTAVALVLSNMAAAIIFLVLGIIVSLAMFFLWLVLTLKAWHGERFSLPLFGNLATRLN
jgi:uncharacterized membrane protein